ncbi:MAG TPA: outer membrane beta-barrel protein [Vicinamibacterales bacterium]
MRIPLLVFVIALCASPAFAQTEGRISAGASATWSLTNDEDVGSALSVGPYIRLNPRRGWGLAGALNWLSVGLENPSGARGDFVRLNARPLMGGVSYTVGDDRRLVSFSIVAGPSFNAVKFDDDYPPRGAEAVDADVSLAIRPGIGISWTVAPRVAITGFGGYLINRPDIEYRNAAGITVRDRWSASAVVLSTGLVYSFF